jgi:hypothetical protein
LVNNSIDNQLKHWKQLVDEAGSSTLSKKAWCRQKGINESTFYYWQRRIRKAALVGKKIPSPDRAVPQTRSDFVEVFFNDDEHPSPDKAVEGGVLQPEIMLQINSYRLLIAGTIQEQTLRTVIKVLRDA